MKKAIVKNILGLCVAATMFAGNAEAGQVNTIIDTGSGMFAEPEKIYQEIDDTIKGWFFPSEEEMREMTFTQRRALKEAAPTLIPASESDAIVQIYREEKGVAASTDQMVTGMQGRDLTLTKADFANLSTELGADYIMYFRVTNTVPTVSVGFMSAGQKTNVTTDFRVWDAAKGNYVFVKRYVTTGSSSSFYAGMGSASNAVKDGLEKALKQISEDKAKIVEVVK